MRLASLLLCSLSAVLPAQGFGTVYTQTNAATDNAVAVALRLPHGGLVPLANYRTGGDGTGTGLGSQGALAMAEHDRWLLAVNAGSDEVSVFRVFLGVLLWRTDTQASGGDQPTSVAVHGDLVYVLNAGSNNNVSGFRLQGGNLRPIANATYALSQNGAMPAQVGFDPSGRFLVVSERATDKLDVFLVRRDGTLGPISVQPSSGRTPFGFAFTDGGTLVVSEAAGGAANASTTSSYGLRTDGMLLPITAAAPTMQTAACWVAIPRGDRFAYTTNAGSSSLSGYAIGRDGRLRLLDPTGVSGMLGMGATPIDAGFERHGLTLFVLDAGNDEITALRRDGQGALHALPGAWSLPDGAAGLIAR